MARLLVLTLALAAMALSTCFTSPSALAEPMHFEAHRTGGNHCCNWIQATGKIDADSASTFERFFKTTEFVPSVVRLNSPGGDLLGGISLGETFRKLHISTEVGSDSKTNFNIGDETMYSTEPGICASACAYAFLGGETRSLEPDAKLGFHRFYNAEELASFSSKMFSGQDLDNTQKTTAGLLLYVVSMGVDARLLALASAAGPNEVWWIGQQDARELRVVYDPGGYKPWRVEPYENGAIAVSESNDGSRSVVAGCSTRSGPYVALVDTRPSVDEAWLNQCRASGAIGGGHRVFGSIVQPKQVTLSRLKKGGVIMTFHLPTLKPPLTSSHLLTFDTGYPMVCSSGDYVASTDNFVPSVRLAFRNCYN